MMRRKNILALCLVALTMAPNSGAAAGWDCTAKLICSDTFPCDPGDVAQSIKLQIIESDGAAVATIWSGANGVSESAALSLLSKSGTSPRHFLQLQDDGTAILLSVFEDGALLVTSQGLVLGSPYLGSATGLCKEIG